MQTIFVVTFAVLIVALAVLFIFHLLLPMPPSNEKKSLSYRLSLELFYLKRYILLQRLYQAKPNN